MAHTVGSTCAGVSRCKHTEPGSSACRTHDTGIHPPGHSSVGTASTSGEPWQQHNICSLAANLSSRTIQLCSFISSTTDRCGSDAVSHVWCILIGFQESVDLHGCAVLQGSLQPGVRLCQGSIAAPPILHWHRCHSICRRPLRPVSLGLADMFWDGEEEEEEAEESTEGKDAGGDDAGSGGAGRPGGEAEESAQELQRQQVHHCTLVLQCRRAS